MLIGKMKSYFEFIRYCLDERLATPASVQDMYWEGLFLFMQQQALLGIGFHGIERLKAGGVDIPRQLLLKWYSLSERIRLQNELLNKRAVELVRMLDREGFRCCILKGQGNAVLYPNPYARTSGDIDIWVDGSRQDIMAFVQRRFPRTDLRYHHVDYPVFKDVETEVHFVPSSMNNPVHNRRLRKWFEENKNGQFRHHASLPGDAGQIPVPTNGFNVVYQLSHLMHHFFDEGIGLRQMMDYYFVLKHADSSSSDKAVLKKTLRHLGMYRFAGAVMYIMQEVFGLEAEWLIVPVDVRRGKTLMEEILKGGNFGKHSGLTAHSTGVKYFLKIHRNMRFVREYPSEALCEPVFRTWHFFWRMCH